jgi:Fe2+ or Zn2+ uptake regulation protein
MAASKRGLSLEEKRKRMLDFFFEKQDFFQLKDVEKLCSQEKGITLQTVKDVLASLVDDGLVDSEKIGTSIYYWSLPSKALQRRREKLDELEKECELEKVKCKKMSEELKCKLLSDEEEAKRLELFEEYNRLVEVNQSLIKQLDAHKQNDPHAYEELCLSVAISKSACNRWIDNIFAVRDWLKKKFRIDEGIINKQFDIPAELDYFQ